jgi:glycosyltransferase involved in cell wall biosynthesis
MPNEGVIGRKLKTRKIRTIFTSRLRERFYEMRFQKRNCLTRFLSLVLNGFDSIIFIGKLTKIIKREKVDLIYCNHMMVKIMGALAGFVKGCPVIFHCRTIYGNPFQRLFYISFAALPNVKRIISVSEASARNFKLLKHKVRVVPNGADLEEHNPEMIQGDLKTQFHISSSTTVIGYIGRLVKWKGIDVFLQVAEDLLLIRNNIAFVVIGDIPIGSTNDRLDKYRLNIAKKGLAQQVFFTGFKDDIRSYLKDLDIVVVPSIKPDPCPRTVIEAMAFGIPIVGSALGGIQETIEHEHTGLLSEPGNVSHLTSQILKICDNKGLRRRLSLQARKTVRARLDAENISHRIQNIIFDALGEHQHN